MQADLIKKVMNSKFAITISFCILLLISSCVKQDIFREPPDYPVIDSLSPAMGFTGTQFRIWGSGFSTYTSQNVVHINGILVRIDSPSTSTAMLATIIDSTGTGPVKLMLNNREVTGPVFTYLGGGVINDAPVITGADYDNNAEPPFYYLLVKKVPPTNSGIRVLIRGVNIPIETVLRPGDPRYDARKGFEIIVADDNLILKNTEGFYANFIVTYNGVPSNIYPLQINPEIDNILSPRGNFQFAAGDTLTILGKYFGDRALLVSSIVMTYRQKILNSPAILSWNNQQIKAVIPKYPEVIKDSGNSIVLNIKVGGKIDRQNLSIGYLEPDPASETYTKIEYSGTGSLSEPRKYLAAAGTGNTVIFAGGLNGNGKYSDKADIYDVVANTWSEARLSEARYELAAAAAGNKIVFAGGYGAAGYSKTVDIYNTETRQWSVAKLSEARMNLAGAGTESIIIFAGGETNRGTTGSSGVVDMYDVNTGEWTTAQLTEPRSQLAAAAVGEKILFAGGHNSRSGSDAKKVDIYNVRSQQWIASELSQARYLFSGAGTGNKILFAGGRTSLTGTGSGKVDIYDALSNTWSFSNLSQTRDGNASAGRGNKIVFGSGSTFDIYDVSSNSWISGRWSEDKFQPAAASAGNKILFGGGETLTGRGVTSMVEIFTLSK